MLAEIFERRSNPDYARRLASTAIAVAGDAITGSGMDASLLLLWRARIDGAPPPPAAIASLQDAVGAEHALVVAHRTR